MKILILLLFPLFSIAQLSGIPEQDSLLRLKDALFIKGTIQEQTRDLNAVETKMLYAWVDYQWIQWVKQPKIVYEIIKPEFKPEFFAPKEFKVKCICERRDTIIKRPPVIDYKDFLDWRIKEVLKLN